MLDQVQEQAVEVTGDVSATTTVGHTVSVTPKEATGTAKTQKTTNEESKDWRKSDKEWQQMTEDAQKGKAAADQLEKLKEALGLEQQKPNEDVDVVTALSQKIEALEMETAKARWEKSHPAVDSLEYREKWDEIVKAKGHLVKAGELSYDDLWALVRKDSKPSTSTRDFKEQELSVGSVPVASKSVPVGSEIDPDIYAAMKKAGYTDEQIRLSA